jgi:tRNA pseudouridine13 synthase
MSWPFLTSDIPPIDARIKQRLSDFLVEELPLYEASGEGDHVYLEVEKRQLTTHEAVRIVAKKLGVAPRDVGYAGQKDAQGITRQWLSVEHADPTRAASIATDRMRVLRVSRHRNKLRIGHLRGNRFALKLRGVEASRRRDLEGVLEILARRGVPNYFGPQRFGARGDNARIGRALLHGQYGEALAQFAGRPGPADAGAVLAARRSFDAADFERAARTWPRGFRDAIRASHVMQRTGGNAREAIRAIDRNLLRLCISAYQSELFNHVLAARLGSIDRVEVGDLAWKHGNGAVFLVEDERESERAQRFEISPTGPLFGRRMSEARGRPAEVELAALAEAGETAETFNARGPWQPEGGRRPLRFPIAELAWETGTDEHGDFVELRFVLPPGSYATALVAEICKDRE